MKAMTAGEILVRARNAFKMGEFPLVEKLALRILEEQPDSAVAYNLLGSVCEKTGRFRPEDDVLVLDGIPRNSRQAEMLDGTLDVKAIFYLHCTNFEAMVERLQRRALKENRLDDANIEVIRDRLKVYDKETKPVLNFYGKKFVHRIDSTQTPVKVLRDLLSKVDKALN